MTEKSIVGDLINFRGLVYSPLNENGVIFLFGKVVEDLNMYIEEIKPGFPDCIARRFTGNGWERLSIEFEYFSSNFKSHKHNPQSCDMIVCWEHDWKECPIEVIPLKDVIQGLENYPVKKPDKSPTKDGKSFNEYFKELPDKVQSIFLLLDQKVKGISSDIWRKELDKPQVTYYSPERVFIYLELQKRGLKLTIFTRGENIEGIKPFNYDTGGEKWGQIHINDETQIELIFPALKKSHELVKDALKHNEPTGWYATL